MWHTQIECYDALKLLDDIKDREYAVIYADPPYWTANTTAYKHQSFNIDDLTDLFLAQKGKVAISGYPGEWDHLGWHKEIKGATRYNIKNVPEPRTEVLWMNYDYREL